MKMSPITKVEVEKVLPEVETETILEDAAETDKIELTTDQIKMLGEILPVLGEILPSLVKLIRGEATIEIEETEDEEEIIEEELDEEEIIDEELDEEFEEDLEEEIIEEELDEEEPVEEIEEVVVEDEATVPPVKKTNLNDEAFKPFANSKTKPTVVVKKEVKLSKPFASRWE